MRLISVIPSPVIAITSTGFVATVAQIIFIRELLVLFYGNELSSGLIFACWLLWSGLGSGLAGKWALKIPAQTGLLGLMLVCLSAMLPLVVLFIRASRIIWMLPAGELPSIGKMLVISGAATGLFCPLTGALFGICWVIHRKAGTDQPLGVYLGESLGSAAGGLLFYFFFVPHLPVFTTVWLTSGMILTAAWWLLKPWRPLSGLRWGHAWWLVAAITLASAALSGPRLEHISRRWQWGPHLSAVTDTPFHNIALLKKEDQLSVFTNGLWLFSDPDRLSAEFGAHLALLQHPRPTSVLVLGGGVAGLLGELFRQPGIRAVDYVEPDSEFIDFLLPHLSPAANAALQDSRLRLWYRDHRMFLRQSQTAYDVILLNVGDPLTAQMNRFYTTEFFALVKQRLAPGGVFSFAVTGGESMLGPAQARFIGSIRKTLLAVFPEILIYPGSQVRFLAAERSGVLLADAASLARRIAKRELELTYITEEILADALSPWRLDYFTSILAGVSGTAVNRDFYPICYFNSLTMWANQWHAGLQKLLQILAAAQLRWVFSILAIAGGIIVAFFWSGRSRFRLAVAGSIFVSGAVEMVLQVVFLLGFQILAGFVYRQLALIVAFFMTGLAVGAWWVARLHRVQPGIEVARKQFIGIQALVCFLPLVVILFLLMMHGELQQFLSPAAVGWLFAVISLITGVLGGTHFALGVAVATAAGIAVDKLGGGFYALDLVGAAAGALLAALFVLPVFGIIHTLVLLSILSVISLLTLLRRP